MHASKAFPLSVLMLSVALAGCTGGSDGLGIEVTPSDDPVTQPYHFKATGSADRFLWDFQDGTAIVEGREVDHLFGFTDGVITVKLTGETGDDSQSAETKLTLGTGQNHILTPRMEISTDWVTPSDTIYMSGASSTDPDGDPLLYRWSCSKAAELKPPTDSHGITSALPFGVQVRGSENPALTSADTVHSGDLCAALSGGDFSRESSVGGSFSETGVYDVRMEVRDPKGAAFVAWIEVFVSNSVPPATTTKVFNGTLTVGSGGSLQEAIDQAKDAAATGGVPPQDQPADFDTKVHTFDVPISNRVAYVTVETSSQIEGAPAVVGWEIKSGSAQISSKTTETEKALDKGLLKNGRDYDLIVTLEDQSQVVDYTITMVIENDLEPRNLYADPIDSHG